MKIFSSRVEKYSMDRLSIVILGLLPQHLLSKLVGKITKIETFWLKNLIIKIFIKKYKVDLSQARNKNVATYKTFNSFFTRAIDHNLRPISQEGIVSPVDGKVSFIGELKDNIEFLVKGKSFDLNSLLANDTEKIKHFKNSKFLTIYLSPKDYHRIHIPLNGSLKEMVFVPGTLFSVNEFSVKKIPNLFSKNERLICYFDTDEGLVALIMVGAIFVGSMQTVWHGNVHENKLRSWKYGDDQNLYFNKGEEIARFNMGSTVIMLKSKNTNAFFKKLKGRSILMGERVS